MFKHFCSLLSSIVVLTSFVFTQSASLKYGQIPPALSYTGYRTGDNISHAQSMMRDTVYLLDFWATWCSPCIAAIPHMDSLIEVYRGKNVKFISITYEPKELVAKFLREHPMKSEIGLDNDFMLFRSYNAWAIPNIVMINIKGEIAGRIHPNHLTVRVIDDLRKGKIPNVKNTPEDLFEPKKAEEYFRSLLEKK